MWSSSFDGRALAARRARHSVREALSGELLVSELATNGVRHAGRSGGEISLEAAIDDDCVRLLVCDEGGGFDEAEPLPPPDIRHGAGFGLRLVDKLSDRWGTRHDGGFCVWFEVQRC